jgi:hypothetical protein
MMVLHGWTMKMVDQKGTLTRAQESHYIGNWHHSDHGCPPRTEHLEPDQLGAPGPLCPVRHAPGCSRPCDPQVFDRRGMTRREPRRFRWKLRGLRPRCRGRY